jgi:ribA/ribD-fused uncharacterized protein
VGVFEGKVGSEYVPPAVIEEENVVEEEAGPGAIAAQRVKEFEEKEAEREEAKRQEFVIENEVEGAAPGTGEPIYFNAAKIDTNKELDNRFPAPFTLDGKTWPTVEHYYQASKFPTLPEFQEQIRLMPSATAAMKAGKTKDPSKPIRADWKEQREPSMRKAIFAKFDQNPALKEKIVATYPSPLIFADANDSFWGYGRTKMGQNKLGSLLMNYRSMHTGME